MCICIAPILNVVCSVGVLLTSSHCLCSRLAVSNEAPEHPCVSPVSGAVFERRLIEKYINDNGVDPVANKPLSADDLIDIKGNFYAN